MIELTGRIVVIPRSVALFVKTFESDDTGMQEEFEIMLIAFYVVFGLVCIREFYGVRKSVNKAMKCITDKVDLGELPCSWVELGAINLYYFRVVNFTTIPYEARKKRMKRAHADNSSSEGTGAPTKMKASVRRSRQRSLIGRVLRRGSTYDSDDDDEEEDDKL